MSNIRALIFDFDGLILDTEGPLFQSWQELYQSYGCELSLSDWVNILGTYEASFDPEAELERQTGKSLDWPRIAPQRRQREEDLLADKTAMPGVKDYLEEAQRLGLMLGVASSSPCDWVTGHLSRLGLYGYFDLIRAKDDVRVTKPDPELYLAVLKAMDKQPEQAVVFDDSPNGIRAARRAGIFCIAVPNDLTCKLPLDEADMRLDSLAEISLEELLRKIDAIKGHSPANLKNDQAQGKEVQGRIS